ncbi:MAG: RNA polymerase factor sigma-54 [Gammaproteobacteria bacterium]|nr:RNA polymerase factor sigma-54 [Gammaproteobacteria bacterium]
MSPPRTGLQQSIALRQRAGPRISHSIHLLQMTQLELAAAIESELLDNPLLEIDDAVTDSEPAELLDEPMVAADEVANVDELDSTGEEPELERDSFDRLDPNESIEHEIEWDDQTRHVEMSSSSSATDAGTVLENRARSSTLADHLHEQLRLSACTETEMQIAEIVIEWLNDDGLLALAIPELLQEVQLVVACSKRELEDTLVLLQGFSPLGVCARDLRECLMIQTRAAVGADARVPVALRVLRDAFDALAARNTELIAAELSLPLEQVTAAMDFIAHLKPRPAADFSEARIEYVVAEARVRKVGDDWQIEMLDEHLPTIKITDWYAEYRRMLGRKNRDEQASERLSKDREFLQDCHRRAKLLLSSLRFRNFNVARIVASVVAKQQAFFEHGESAMQPLLLADIADEIGLHNSTVSRLTTGKFLETPRGTYELKYFFSNRVGTQPGKEHSGVAIRAAVKQLIANEDPGSPMSDQEVSSRLKSQNIEISRRTVTKYREALAIPASKDRRRMAI